MVHELKTWPTPFQAMWDGLKTYELRKNDRNFQVGDELWLREWTPHHYVPHPSGFYSGRSIRVTVRYKTDAGTFPGLEPGYVILGVQAFEFQDGATP